MHSYTETTWLKVKYSYKGMEREATVGVVNGGKDGMLYYLSFPNRPPAQFNLKDGVWHDGVYPLHDKDGYLELYHALTKAIEEQIIGK